MAWPDRPSWPDPRCPVRGVRRGLRRTSGVESLWAMALCDNPSNEPSCSPVRSRRRDGSAERGLSLGLRMVEYDGRWVTWSVGLCRLCRCGRPRAPAQAGHPWHSRDGRSSPRPGPSRSPTWSAASPTRLGRSTTNPLFRGRSHQVGRSLLLGKRLDRLLLSHFIDCFSRGSVPFLVERSAQRFRQRIPLRGLFPY